MSNGIDVISDTTGLAIAAAGEKQASNLKELISIQLRIAEATEKTLSNKELETESSLSNYVLSNLRENTDVKVYNSVREYWFTAKGAKRLSGGSNGSDYKALTKLVSEWYKLTRQLVKDWDGWTRFAHPDRLSISTGTKMGSNSNLVCEPSTETVAGRDDYAGNPLFAITYCNWKMVNNEPIITAIKDVSPDFSFYDKDKYVGVLQMSAYVHWTELEESSDHYDRGYCATLKPYSHIEPLPESVALDGTMREWVLHGACPAGVKDDGTYTACYGVEPSWHGMSHNNINTVTAKMGNGISGACTCDWSFLKWMTYIKYGSLTLDGILNGTYGYWYSDAAQISETGVKRIIVPLASMNNYIVGSQVRIDNWDGVSTDFWGHRNKDTMAITGSHSVTITDIQKVNINDTDYGAIYVDIDTPFDTIISDGSTTRIYTFIWHTGSTANVLGNDGGIMPKDGTGRAPVKLQGIEFALGQYEVYTDTIYNMTSENDEFYGQPYICKLYSKRSTDLTGDYNAVDSKVKALSALGSVKYEKYSNGMFFATVTGGSSSTYHKDAIYLYKSAGTREILGFGALGYVVGYAGLGFAYCDHGLGGSDFSCGSRLSPNGNRG